jgi:hypothetical protein
VAKGKREFVTVSPEVDCAKLFAKTPRIQAIDCRIFRETWIFRNYFGNPEA